jgi:hypothetical protein
MAKADDAKLKKSRIFEFARAGSMSRAQCQAWRARLMIGSD